MAIMVTVSFIDLCYSNWATQSARVHGNIIFEAVYVLTKSQKAEDKVLMSWGFCKETLAQSVESTVDPVEHLRWT